MLNSTNLQLLNQTQRELLEELDQENRQLKQQLKQQGQLMHQVQNVLTRYGATQGLSLTDQIEILMTQHQQRKFSQSRRRQRPQPSSRSTISSRCWLFSGRATPR
uniref:Uncharacterized protein n=1 Tax=Spironucleus salmonicida TaxID=348837 RepID=V6LVF9_9EUKA|eukprot:EST48218.1 Hypothetical protein SS50377_11660 [Spironucleus salmonicida]